MLEQLAADAEAAGALEDAVRVSRRRVALDPLREDAHRELIRRLIAAGEISAARVAFDDLARRLRAALHVPPSRETRRLLEIIHAHGDGPASVATEAPPPLPAPLAGESAARSSVARTRSAGFVPSGREARGGAGRLAVIAGDPGIGKTRLASELARAAHAEGAAVLLGRCHEEVLISYQPFVEAIGRYAAAASPEVLRSQLGTHGGELVRLVPDLARRLPDLPEPASGDADGQRFRLFEAAGC